MFIRAGEVADSGLKQVRSESCEIGAPGLVGSRGKSRQRGRRRSYYDQWS